MNYHEVMSSLPVIEEELLTQKMREEEEELEEEDDGGDKDVVAGNGNENVLEDRLSSYLSRSAFGRKTPPVFTPVDVKKAFQEHRQSESSSHSREGNGNDEETAVDASTSDFTESTEDSPPGVVPETDESNSDSHYSYDGDNNRDEYDNNVNAAVDYEMQIALKEMKETGCFSQDELELVSFYSQYKPQSCAVTENGDSNEGNGGEPQQQEQEEQPGSPSSSKSNKKKKGFQKWLSKKRNAYVQKQKLKQRVQELEEKITANNMSVLEEFLGVQ